MIATDYYELAIIGGGPAGYSAALRAGTLGMKTALIEKDKVGGLCLHRGCIPSKTLLQSAKMKSSIERSSKLGFTVTDFNFDWDQIWQRKDRVVNQLFEGLKSLLVSREIDLIQGTANIEPIERSQNDYVINLQNGGPARRIIAKNLIIATGTKSHIPMQVNHPGNGIMTTDEIFTELPLPRQMIICGGGPTGIEFGSLFSAFGVKVIIIESADRVLPAMDKDISKEIARQLRKRGIEIITGARTTEINKGTQMNVEVVLQNKDGSTDKKHADNFLFAAGRRPSFEGLEGLGIETNHIGCIATDEFMRTNLQNVYACGDINGKANLAHIAFEEGIIAAEQAAGETSQPINYDNIPWCVYSEPEIAQTGLTEDTARERFGEINITKVNLTAIPRALIDDHTEGFVKLITDKHGRLLGCHMIGHKLTEMSAEMQQYMNWDADLNDALSAIHPHPTISEIISETVKLAAGKPLHIATTRKRRKAA